MFCTETAEIWQFVGEILTIFKIVIPVIIIIMGAIDLGKAVLASDEKEIKNATSSLVRRFIAGIIIFFIPMIVNVLFGVLDGFSEVEKDYTTCSSCVANPSGVDCKDAVCAVNPENEICGEE